MKKIIAFLILLPVIGFAQEGKPLKSIAIPRTDTPLPDKKPEDQTEAPQYSISKPFEPKMFKSPKKVYEAPQLENKIGMGNQPKSDLKPGLDFEKKLNKPFQPEDDAKVYRGNQFLGDFKTKSGSAKIVYRDHEFVDGDLIRIWVNGVVVVDYVYLEGSFGKLDLGLIKGINKVEFEALNQGSSGPNTAEFKVYDDNGGIISANKWNLATGFKASILIVKE